MFDDSLILDNTNYILIDMSYFIFYRFYALVNWWSFAKKDEPLDMEEILSNEIFVEKFRSTFIKKLNEIPGRLNLKDFLFIVAKDCPRKDIWRRGIFPDYKENRVYEDGCVVSKFFEIGYEIIKRERYSILFHDKLEADDCIALATKHILFKCKQSKIYIIASDTDYLQLASPIVNIINLKYKNLRESRSCTGDSKKDLFCKIVMGDKSDNIPGIFNRCGLKTAIKCYEDDGYFNKKLEKEEGSDEKYERNKTLIDFTQIPDNLEIELLQ